MRVLMGVRAQVNYTCGGLTNSNLKTWMKRGRKAGTFPNEASKAGAFGHAPADKPSTPGPCPVCGDPGRMSPGCPGCAHQLQCL